MTDTSITEEELAFLPQRYEGKVPIDQPVPHPENPKLHDDEAITESMKGNGFFGVIYMQESTNFILAGHGRWENAKALGATTIPAVFIECDDATARRILLSDNIGWKGGFDDPKLAELLGQMQDAGELFGTGYGPDDVDDLLAKLGEQFTPPEQFTGGYVEDENEAKHRAERKATTKASLGLHEMVLVYDDDDYDKLRRALAVVEEFHSAGSTSEAVMAGITNYALSIKEDES